MKDKGIRHLKRHHLISLSLIIFFLSLESVFTFNTRRPSPLFSLSALPSAAIDAISAHNNSLDYLRGTLGYSYMCREEQTLNAVQNLSINTFQVQVQPFGLTGNQFGAGKH